MARKTQKKGPQVTLQYAPEEVSFGHYLQKKMRFAPKSPRGVTSISVNLRRTGAASEVEAASDRSGSAFRRGRIWC